VGVRTDGILAYGYDLGGEDEWKVREADEYGGLIPGTGRWVPDPEAEEDYDLISLALRQLLDASGFTETYEDGNEGYFGREDEAEKALGVEFKAYCSGEYSQYLLAAKVLTAGRGDVEDVSVLMAEADEARLREWDGKLRRALEVLGLTPLQERPKWLLCSYRG
jgi:hypothetical protein